MIARKKLKLWVNSLNTRERFLVGGAALAILFCAIYFPYQGLQEKLIKERALVSSRKADLSTLKASLSKLRLLNNRLERVQQSYSEALMTFEQVTAELDKTVRASIGSGDYDLKVSGAPNKLGMGFERQEFVLNVKSLSLEQLVKLIHNLEQGDSPLFLGKVDVRKASARGKKGTSFSTTLEVFSVRKQKA